MFQIPTEFRAHTERSEPHAAEEIPFCNSFIFKKIAIKSVGDVLIFISPQCNVISPRNNRARTAIGPGFYQVSIQKIIMPPIVLVPFMVSILIVFKNTVCHLFWSDQ